MIKGFWPIMYENVCTRCLATHYRHDEEKSVYVLKCTVCGRDSRQCPSYPSCEPGFQALGEKE